VLNEKAILYDQLHSSARQLINRDDIVLKNEAEFVRLKYEIDLQGLEMQQKQEIVQDLKEELEIEKARYKGLKQEVKRLEKRAE
jgi:predicted RNase H-like nuclease (RuvC/YqgF family)